MVGSGFGLLLFAGITLPYRIRRLLTFINPNQDPLGTGYINIQLNKITHSTGLFGQGFNFPRVIPEVHTDFVFTYIVHTFGWIAGIILAALVITFLMRLTYSAMIIKNSYGKLLVSGFVTVFAVRFFWNILMNIGLAPIFGVGLPFISYGGSQFIFGMLAMSVATEDVENAFCTNKLGKNMKNVEQYMAWNYFS